MRQIDKIIVHCAATRPEWMSGQSVTAKRDEIDRWHRGNGWAGIGYHFLIDRDGAVAEGRSIARAGAHVKGQNKTSIGICLVGGHGAAKDDEFTDHFTAAQDKALRKLISRLRRDFPSIRSVSGHNQWANKGCPGFYVPIWLDGARTAPIIPDVEPVDYPAAPWWVHLFQAIARAFK